MSKSTLKYIGKRLLISVVTLFVILVVLFLIVKLLPGSPINNERLSEAQRAAIEARYGLDQPILTQFVNYVKNIYAPFSQEEISLKIAEMLTPADTNAQVEIVYQTLDGLHRAIPNHPGDWYFSGDYPTPGGNRLVNNASINFMEGDYQKRS